MKLFLPALLGLLLLTGCGSDSDERNGYVRQLNAAQQQFSLAARSVTAEIDGEGTSRSYRVTLRRYQRAIDRVVGDLRAIDAPDSVKDDHQKLISAMVSFGKDIRQAGDTLRDPTTTTLAAVPDDMRNAERRVNQRVATATAAINDKLG